MKTYDLEIYGLHDTEKGRNYITISYYPKLPILISLY